MNTTLSIELVKGSLTLAAALLSVWFGLQFYFRQKEYELVK